MNNFNPIVGNNFYPNQRNPYFPTQSYFNVNSTSVASASTNNLIWVQGIEGAKAWQLQPNSMVILLDSEVEGKMYIKVSDNIGMSTLRIFNYIEEVPISATSSINNVTVNEDVDLSQYVKKDELRELIKELMTKDEQSISATTETNDTKQQPKVTIIKKQS